MIDRNARIARIAGIARIDGIDGIDGMDGTRRGASKLAGAAALLLLFALTAGCKKDGPTTPPHDLGPDHPAADQAVCKRPPLALCERPPYGASCKTTWFCPGCLCTGATKVAACNPLNNDCRYFCTGCYPDEYVLCDQNASAHLLARCGYCFLNDAGGPARCNIIGPHDGGVDAK